jgi:hypothetical protein
VEAILMMRPQPRWRMVGSSKRLVWNTALRLMASTLSHWAGGKASMGATCWMPALLTRMSTPPVSCAAKAHSASIWAGSDKSAG